MEKIQATAVRPGMVVMFNDQPHRVLSFQHRTPGKGNAVVQIKLRGMRTGLQTETRLMSTDHIERVAVTGREMEYLYKDADGYVFMDTETYEQITLPQEMLEEEAPWLEENMRVTVQYVGDEPLGIELPKVVEVRVEETEPPLKGATASASPKPARLANGVTIKVPQFIEAGEVVRVDPTEGRYIERAK
ncbi:MAG: elongation factor P [Candidatus Dadabacteria bacterium]|nr:MAG: elongation factor P [Candidatus Dadabacteria bacterium]